MISQEYLKERFSYDPEGFLVWLPHDSLKFKPGLIGTRAGSVSSKGYMIIRINGKPYPAHRMIFLFHHGFLPKKVDHKDTNKLNNAIWNLRGATDSQNKMNTATSANNLLGVKNIRATPNGTYQVRVTKDGKTTTKTCSSLEEATSFRDALLKELHGEFANNGENTLGRPSCITSRP